MTNDFITELEYGLAKINHKHAKTGLRIAGTVVVVHTAWQVLIGIILAVNIWVTLTLAVVFAISWGIVAFGYYLMLMRSKATISEYEDRSAS